jgi:hypothetical protein
MVVGGFNEMLCSYILLFLAELALPIQPAASVKKN